MSAGKVKVRLLFSTLGAKKGSVVEVSEAEAVRLAKHGHAVRVPVEAKPAKQDDNKS